MDAKGDLILNLVTTSGGRPKDSFDITLKHTVLSLSVQKKNLPASQTIRLTELDATQGGTYQLLIKPKRHRPVGCFIRIEEDRETPLNLTLAVRPDKVREVEFPKHAALLDDLKRAFAVSAVAGFEGGEGENLYRALDNVRRAGLLNIFAKMKATRLTDGRDTFSFIQSFTEIRQDRFFARADGELLVAVKRDAEKGLFRKASKTSHDEPDGFELAESYKTDDRYGNLQLTFSVNPETEEIVVDADIDDANGIGHIFQVLSHFLTGKETHPYDIREILLQYQKINPGYDLIV
ncbi:MAG: hypothetical protein ACREBD_12550 [Blastocatellia bacterium]